MAASDPILRRVCHVVAEHYGIALDALTAGSRQAIVGAEDRPWISRVVLHGVPPGVPHTVIVKRSRDGGLFDADDPDHAQAWGFFPDWVGLRFLSDLDVSPAYLGGDMARGVVVMDDLGTAPDLCHLLHGQERETAEAALLSYSHALARLHGGTAGRREAYLTAWSALVPQRPPPCVTDDLPDAVTRATTVISASLGISFDAQVVQELEGVVAALRDPGPFLTYIHGDACPDNAVLTARGIRLIDFQSGGFGHCLYDAAYLHVPWPTCWCDADMPAHVVKNAEQVYRTTLAPVVPEVLDDLLYRRALAQVVAAHLVWMLANLLPLALHTERTATQLIYRGVRRPTRRQQVVQRLDRFALVGDAGGGVSALVRLSEELAACLRRRWPEDTAAIDLFPAFQLR